MQMLACFQMLLTYEFLSQNKMAKFVANYHRHAHGKVKRLVMGLHMKLFVMERAMTFIST